MASVRSATTTMRRTEETNSTAVQPGETKVAVSLPANRRATLVAVDGVNGTVVAKQPLATSGRRVV